MKSDLDDHAMEEANIDSSIIELQLPDSTQHVDNNLQFRSDDDMAAAIREMTMDPHQHLDMMDMLPQPPTSLPPSFEDEEYFSGEESKALLDKFTAVHPNTTTATTTTTTTTTTNADDSIAQSEPDNTAVAYNELHTFTESTLTNNTDANENDTTTTTTTNTNVNAATTSTNIITSDSSETSTALLSPNGVWLEKQLGRRAEPELINPGEIQLYPIPKYKPGPRYGPTTTAPQQELPRVQRIKSRQASVASSDNSASESEGDDHPGSLSPPIVDITITTDVTDSANANATTHSTALNTQTTSPLSLAVPPPASTDVTLTDATATISDVQMLSRPTSLTQEKLQKVAEFLKTKESSANSPLAAANFCPEDVLCMPTKDFNLFLKQNFSESLITLLKSSRRRMKNRLYAKGSRERKRPGGSSTSRSPSPLGLRSPSPIGKSPLRKRYSDYSDSDSSSSTQSSPANSPRATPTSSPVLSRRSSFTESLETYISSKMGAPKSPP
eukprot:m.175068 g.175068  ORF g.175068 m.175068 type:complete len:500 (-) comp31796_c0_seq2:171-1670(-)